MSTTTKKNNKIEKEVAEVKQATTPKRQTRKILKQIDPNEMVLVRSVFQGTLCYKSIRTGLKVVWNGYGSEEWISIQELLTMKASNPTFLTKPWLIIDDLDVVEHMGLKDIYNVITEIEDLDAMFTLSINEIKEKIKIAPKGFKDTIADTARKLVLEEKLYDIRVIRMLEEELQIELN